MSESEDRIEEPTVDYRASFRSAAKDLAKAKRKLNAREAQLVALGHDLAACYLHMSELAGGPSLTDWSARMQELHFDARCALPEAQSLCEFWEKQARELELLLQELVNARDALEITGPIAADQRKEIVRAVLAREKAARERAQEFLTSAF